MSASNPSAGPQPVTHARVVGIALPMMLAHATEPLLGLVDTGVIGRLGDPALIGGVAIAGSLFSFLFWAFGGLRMSTAGFVAQAVGASDSAEIDHVAARALALAAICGVALITLQVPIAALALPLFGASDAVTSAARIYYDTRIWSAPFAFANYAVLGVLIGRGRTGQALALQVLINLANAALTVGFVQGLAMGVAGAALGTVLAQVVGVAAGLVVLHRGGFRPLSLAAAGVLERAALMRTLAVNGDFMIRSAALLFAIVYFNAASARLGDITLAANALLAQLFAVSAYMLDGFATASETLCGQSLGARNRAQFKRAVAIALIWAQATGIVFAVFILLGGHPFLQIMTTSVEVRTAAAHYLPLVALTAVAGAAAFVFDGVYGGATWNTMARNLMILALGVFLLLAKLLSGLGNSGLWLAFTGFLATRGLAQAAMLPRLLDGAFGTRNSPPPPERR